MKIIDLTHTITEDMPVFPGTEQPQLTAVASYEPDGYRETLIRMCSHVGTHVDSPAHILKKGQTLDLVPLAQFIGKAIVIDCRHLNSGEPITIKEVMAAGENVKAADFLLFNTGWDKFWGAKEYFDDYPCIDDEVIEFLVNLRFKGIGLDVMGVDPIFDGRLPRHKKLLENNLIIIENLTNLDQCRRGLFNFSCFPLKIANIDGAPVRAVAWWDDGK